MKLFIDNKNYCAIFIYNYMFYRGVEVKKSLKITVLSVSFLILLLIIYRYNTNDKDFMIIDDDVNSEIFEAKDYWSYYEWQETFPEQKALIRQFEEIVVQKGVDANISDMEKVKIAIVYPAVQASDYWIKNVKAFRARLDELGINYELETFFSTPGDVVLQNTQINRVLDSDYDYLVTSLDEMADLGLIERILSEKRIKLILQNITTPLRRFGINQPLLYTGFDHEEGAVLLAEKYLERFKGGGDWILLLFTDGVVSRDRGGVFLREISKSGKYNLKGIYKTEGKREIAKKAVIDAIETFEKINFIYSCATDVSLGALDALSELKIKSDVFLNGWGGGSLELDLIKQNLLDITVMRINDDTAVAMAEAIRLDLQGRTNEIPVVYSGSFEIVDKTKIDRINQLKKQAFRYSSEER